MDSVLTIGEVSRRSGVASSALRFYEERGLISWCERAQGIGAIRDPCCVALRSLSSRSGSGWRSGKSVWSSPSFLPIVFPPARTGRAFRDNGRAGSIKGLLSFSVSEQG